MKDRDAFVRARASDWSELDQLLYRMRGKSLSAAQISRLGQLYRDLCSDLMKARGQGAGPDVVSHLDALAARAHNQLYRFRAYRAGVVKQVLLRDFPRAVRRNLAFILMSLGLFGVPMLIGTFGALSSREFALAVLPNSMLEQMAESYREGFSAGRNADADAAMAGFYVYNNIGIAFRCFATGILFGLGSLFFLVYNGLVIGTVFGHVAASGGGPNILAFVSGHSAFELTAIVISGGAGLRMGYSLIDTGGMTRIASLRAQAGSLIALISGAAVMLLIAAGIEGFWSPSSVPARIKWAVGAMNLVLVVLFLALAGREPQRAKEAS